MQRNSKICAQILPHKMATDNSESSESKKSVRMLSVQIAIFIGAKAVCPSFLNNISEMFSKIFGCFRKFNCCFLLTSFAALSSRLDGFRCCVHCLILLKTWHCRRRSCSRVNGRVLSCSRANSPIFTLSQICCATAATRSSGLPRRHHQQPRRHGRAGAFRQGHLPHRLGISAS